MPARSASAGDQFDSRRGIERWDIWARRNSVCRKRQRRKREPAKKADDFDTHIKLLKVKFPSPSLDSSIPPSHALTAVNSMSRPKTEAISSLLWRQFLTTVSAVITRAIDKLPWPDGILRADRDQVFYAGDPRCRPGHPLSLLALGP